MLTRLNIEGPVGGEARGFIAPLIRVATHIGFAIAWVSTATDDTWNPEAGVLAEGQESVREELLADLVEMKSHFMNNDGLIATTWVSEEVANFNNALIRQIGTFIREMPTDKSVVLEELETLTANLSFVGARMERSLTGSLAPDEGRNI